MMSSLSLRHIRKVYPARRKAKAKEKNKAVRSTADYVAVKDFSMEIDDGEFIVFVGPSGCGKSTTLRMIAGLEDISSGELYIDGKLMNNVEPRDRDIAMVFQSYALLLFQRTPTIYTDNCVIVDFLSAFRTEHNKQPPFLLYKYIILEHNVPSQEK